MVSYDLYDCFIAKDMPQDQAVATACSLFFRSVCATVGLALSTLVVQRSLRTLLWEKLGSGRDTDVITESVCLTLNFINTLVPSYRM